jgi:UDP-N-acetylglucosamine--dolichyl-phosphate N-acetylglucosaminephosphotransferase
MLITFVFTFGAIWFLMPYMLGAGITAIDMNKKNRPVLPCGMGTALSFGITIGLLAYTFGASFGLYIPVAPREDLFGAMLSLLLITGVGFIDDINVRDTAGKSTGMMSTRIGLKQWQKPILTLVGAVPLIAINAGISIVSIPFIGMVNFGIVYPLIIIPLAVVFAADAFNLLGGFNGISTASGIIVSAGMLIYSIFFGTYTGALLSGVLTAALFAFAYFDNYPAKIIPGDGYTYGVGAAIVIAAILGNMEFFAIVAFMPWFIEFLLHLMGRFDITDLGKRRSDGTFAAPYGKKVYSWTHIIMNTKRCKEWEVSAYMALITLAFVIAAFAGRIFLIH